MRKPIQQGREDILVRRVGFLPLELHPQDNYFQRLTVRNEIQLTVSQLSGYFKEQTYLIKATRFNELLVAQGGSGIENLTVQAGTAPSSYDSTNHIQRDDGFKRFDLLVETEALDVQYTLMDDTTVGDVKFIPGAYSITFNFSRLQVKKNGATAGTYQIVGYY